ncbi:DUF1905 domain-containing protein [Pseudonocardia humida]|uniref:DUF1905 domain-containing protein n=1 Tax=Pseudonocardia humida TaxID=2800819 RepID=A0ABT0ZUY5_9PSEU|nr:DUF1905 domain-containing protein [Pseudonocardia humida]MCO1654540.1 DUF1905 domain-containing protein [Pseudonocardia humida]
MAYVFDAEVMLWDARKDETWTLISLPVDDAEEIRHRTEGMANGFGSVRVTATIGSSTWQTSIFPDAGQRTYVLPVKKAVRTAEGLTAGDTARVAVELRDF